MAIKAENLHQGCILNADILLPLEDVIIAVGFVWHHSERDNYENWRSRTVGTSSTITCCNAQRPIYELFLICLNASHTAQSLQGGLRRGNSNHGTVICCVTCIQSVCISHTTLQTITNLWWQPEKC